jgi:hypothetical protein
MPRARIGPAHKVRGQPIDLAQPSGVGGRRPILLAGLVLTVGSIWIAVPLFALLTGARPPLPDLGVAGTCVLFTVGVGQVLWGLNLLLRRETLIIDQDSLHVVVRGLSGVRRWSEPLANYRGLRHRRQRVWHRYGWRVVHRLELAHPDPAKEIELARTWGERRIETLRRQWAELLHLPVWSAESVAPRRPSPESDRRAAAPKGVPTF